MSDVKYVLVPRAFVEKYQHSPFSILREAAAAGVDGLEPRTGTSMPPNAERGGSDAVLFRHAELWEFRNDDKTCLHLQNY